MNVRKLQSNTPDLINVNVEYIIDGTGYSNKGK